MGLFNMELVMLIMILKNVKLLKKPLAMASALLFPKALIAGR